MSRSRIIHQTSRLKKDLRGQALVEGSLVILATMCMVLFVLDMGRILLLGQYVTERARVTARQAVVNNWDEDTVKNVLVYNNTQAPGNDTSKPGFLGLTRSMVSYTVLGTQRNGDLRVQVKVSNIQAVMFIPYIAGKYRFPTLTVEVPAQSLGATN